MKSYFWVSFYIWDLSLIHIYISYKEEVNGVVRVSVEGNEFVNENGYYKVEKQTDKATGFVTELE